MIVSFRNDSAGAVRLPKLNPVAEQSQQSVSQVQMPITEKPKSDSFFNKSREIWKTTLKTKETIGAYSSGFFRGLKNAVYAGAALVGIDWLVTSTYNLGKGKKVNGKELTSVGHMLATPFVVAGKTIANGWKFIFGSKSTKNIIARDVSQTLKLAFVEAPKRLFGKIYSSKNVSKVSKWGLPIIAVAVAGYTTFRSCLEANRRAADIDHAYGGKVGHHEA